VPITGAAFTGVPPAVAAAPLPDTDVLPAVLAAVVVVAAVAGLAELLVEVVVEDVAAVAALPVAVLAPVVPVELEVDALPAGLPCSLAASDPPPQPLSSSSISARPASTAGVATECTPLTRQGAASPGRPASALALAAQVAGRRVAV
jgi:hypothetical protein